MNHEALKESKIYLLDVPTQCSVQDASVWLRQAWLLFKQRWGTWLLMMLVYGLIVALLMWGLADFWAGKMPQYAEILKWLVWSLEVVLIVLLTGGMMIAAASLAEENDLKCVYLFSGFQYQFKPLLLLSFIWIAWVACVVWLAVGLVNAVSPQSLWFVMIPLFGGLCGMLTIGMSVFSIVLVVLHDATPFAAITMSIRAVFRNFRVLIRLLVLWKALFLLVGCVVLLVGFLLNVLLGQWVVFMFLSLPLLLSGMLALAILQMYTAYRNVWTNLPME